MACTAATVCCNLTRSPVSTTTQNWRPGSTPVNSPARTRDYPTHHREEFHIMRESDQRPPQPERSAWEGPEAPPPRASDEARPAGKGENWERDMIARLAFASLTEQRRARRWSIFFKILVFLYLFMVFWMYQGKQWELSFVVGVFSVLVVFVVVFADNDEASADNF